eukprot:TRINITY_DN13190_c0_g4_i1.p1 TRINITY_DN13190_c0_g4~~TRINITY_DN13190_c0_g4_i1.p1  ORF type:complete len:578 (+),score=79.63 TRINITY_DN13190_c0_g4_i1:77-1810(+)
MTADSDSGAASDGGGSNSGNARPPKRQRTCRPLANDVVRGVGARTASVCKLFVKKVPANFADPWRKHSQQSSTGTGFLLRNRWIITNAHVVHRAVSVLVRATSGPPVKYNARVVSIGLPCDLAVLEVDGDFWQGKQSLELSRELPRLDDNVTCFGFPVGGENISVTRGVVSRIDVNFEGLFRIQIDAAINPGNSGGPVLGSHGSVVGVAASHLKHASNIGYIIPTAVLEQFLECAASASNGPQYVGVASLGIGRVQTLESPALRRKLGLKEGFTGGVRICSVFPLADAVGRLREDDVLVSIDGVEIGQDATVPLRDNERIHFLHLVTSRLAGRDTVRVRVMRSGQELEEVVALYPNRWLVPRIDGYDAAPEYCIIGGLVFVPLSQPWAELKTNDKEARALILQHLCAALPDEGRQLVILSKVLAHPCNFGFHALSCVVLNTFNSEPIYNLAQLARAADACEADNYVFEFKRPAADGQELVVLDRAECMASEPEILQQHLIGSTSMVRGLGPHYRSRSGVTHLQQFRRCDDAAATTTVAVAKPLAEDIVAADFVVAATVVAAPNDVSSAVGISGSVGK